MEEFPKKKSWGISTYDNWNFKSQISSIFHFDWAIDGRMAHILKYQFWKNVTSEKWNSGGLNTFTTYLSSLLGVIAEYNSNHAQKWRQICCESVQPARVSFFRSDFFRNWYFKICGSMHRRTTTLTVHSVSTIMYVI